MIRKGSSPGSIKSHKPLLEYGKKPLAGIAAIPSIKTHSRKQAFIVTHLISQEAEVTVEEERNSIYSEETRSGKIVTSTR